MSGLRLGAPRFRNLFADARLSVRCLLALARAACGTAVACAIAGSRRRGGREEGPKGACQTGVLCAAAGRRPRAEKAPYQNGPRAAGRQAVGRRRNERAQERPVMKDSLMRRASPSNLGRAAGRRREQPEGRSPAAGSRRLEPECCEKLLRALPRCGRVSEGRVEISRQSDVQHKSESAAFLAQGKLARIEKRSNMVAEPGQIHAP